MDDVYGLAGLNPNCAVGDHDWRYGDCSCGAARPELCGFCISGLVPAKQGEPPTHEVCPYCNGSGWQA